MPPHLRFASRKEPVVILILHEQIQISLFSLDLVHIEAQKESVIPSDDQIIQVIFIGPRFGAAQRDALTVLW